MRATVDLGDERVPDCLPRDPLVEDEYKETAVDREWYFIRTDKDPRRALADYYEKIHQHNKEALRELERANEDTQAARNQAKAAKRKRTIDRKLDACDLVAFFDSQGLTKKQAIKKCKGFIQLYSK